MQLAYCYCDAGKAITYQGNMSKKVAVDYYLKSTIGKDGKHDWGTYPRLSMSGSPTQGRLQHEECFVSTIDIGDQGIIEVGEGQVFVDLSVRKP